MASSTNQNYTSPYTVHTSAYKSQAQKLILNVLHFFKQAKKNPSLLNQAPQKLASQALNVSLRTLTNIRSSVKSGSEIRTPRKRINQPKLKQDLMDGFDIMCLKNIIRSFYNQKLCPTLNLIQNRLKAEGIGQSLSKSTLGRLLRRIGYTYKSSGTRIHLTEKSHLKQWRMRYIQRLNENDHSFTPKPVIYLDESWIDCHATINKGWTPKILKSKRDMLDHSLNVKTGKGPRLIMLNAGSKDGFVPGALLLKDSKTCDEDYHKEIDGYGFTNWFQKCLIPNLPRSCIIVMDNAPYHSMTTIPKCNWRVGDMKNWLISKNLPFSPTCNKKQIWEIIKKEKYNYEHYIIDRIARSHGHEILRLPPYHCDLNPIEMVWGHTKRHVAKYNNTGLISDIKVLAEEYMTAYPPETWAKNVSCIQRLASEYQRMDGFSELPPIPGQIVVQIGPDFSDSEDCDSTDDDSVISNDEIDYDVDSEIESFNLEYAKFTPKVLFS